ncbi:hypothetical protein [Rhodococcus sp. NCIMB 12038]|nr:hypothetical protein [Rhodococcus sp. NCIMB 12038]
MMQIDAPVPHLDLHTTPCQPVQNMACGRPRAAVNELVRQVVLLAG